MARRRHRNLAFETTVSVLDFVTICLGATLLLVVMVPAHSGTYASIASRQRALELVREHFARQTRDSTIRLTGDLSASHPGLAPPAAVAPSQLSGMQLSMLPERQRVRRSELLVQFTTDTKTLEHMLTEVAGVLERRGVGYVVVYPFESPAHAGPGADGFGYALGAPSRVRGLAERILHATTLTLEASLAAAVEAEGHTATPAEPVVIVVHEPAPLSRLASAMTATGCPRPGLFLVGPPLDEDGAHALQTLMAGCKRADYVGVEP